MVCCKVWFFPRLERFSQWNGFRPFEFDGTQHHFLTSRKIFFHSLRGFFSLSAGEKKNSFLFNFSKTTIFFFFFSNFFFFFLFPIKPIAIRKNLWKISCEFILMKNSNSNFNVKKQKKNKYAIIFKWFKERLIRGLQKKK